MEKELFATASIQIGKPPHIVFESIVDPDQMSNYFIRNGSSRLVEGEEVIWEFPELDFSFPINVDKVEKDRHISFYWDHEDRKHLVEITLSEYGKDDTVVKVREGSEPNTEKGLLWMQQNTEGWANFLACMKAWLEYGIHLRKGAFDFRFTKEG